MRKLHVLRACLAIAIASGRKLVAAVNAVTNSGIHLAGRFNAVASSTVTIHKLVKLSAAGVVAANDGVPIGVALATETDGYEVGVQALGGAGGTVIVTASAAVLVNAILIADSEKVKTLPTAGGTYYIVGTAITAAAADGDELEMAPCSPVKIVVT